MVLQFIFSDSSAPDRGKSTATQPAASAPQQVAQRVAVVLFNLGGPLKPADVRPFLFNLFNDRAILRLPRLPRWLLAQLISRLRASKARGIYAGLGGGSPLLANTRAQAEALTAALQADSKA
ncbi:MAG: ferrochelatase, partial [Alphaproteobacteria bacterium]|nr:ferrochelatase [Alphaproteobacteria bacterium]